MLFDSKEQVFMLFGRFEKDNKTQILNYWQFHCHMLKWFQQLQLQQAS